MNIAIPIRLYLRELAYAIHVCAARMACNRCVMSEKGIKWLKENERFMPDFYNDEENLAIGSGINMKWYPAIYAELKGRTPITKQRAEHDIRRVLPDYKRGVRLIPNVHLVSQGMCDSLIS